MLIQEPPPPQHSTPTPRHEQKPPAAAPQSKPPAAEQPQPVHTDANAKTPEPELPSAPASATPQLEPLSTVHQKATLQQQINSLKSVVELRIGRLDHLDLSGEDRKALQDARNFLAQSATATKQGDLQQSLNLAQKADLLVAAVEKKH